MTETEEIHKTNGQDYHGKTNLKLWECYYCFIYFFVFKNSKYDFNLCAEYYHCKQREKVFKTALFQLVKVKSGTFRTVSEYESNEIIDLLKKSQLDEKYRVLSKEQEKSKENKKINFTKLLKWSNNQIFIWNWTAISRLKKNECLIY